MRLLIVGSLQGQIGTATKIAMDRGAKVTHANDIDQAMASLRSGVGVERTFKVNSPRIEKIEVVRHGVARRAKLYFLRDRVGKSATLRERRA